MSALFQAACCGALSRGHLVRKNCDSWSQLGGRCYAGSQEWPAAQMNPGWTGCNGARTKHLRGLRAQESNVGGSHTFSGNTPGLDVARRDDNSWIHRVTFWRDSSWQGIVANLADRPRRPSRRRWMRFEDCLRRYKTQTGGANWRTAAQDKTVWNCNAAIFAHWSLAH